MRAAQINSYGHKDVLKVTSDAPRPVAAAGEVLVEVRAASINPFDWKIREGLVQQMGALSFPATLGGDLSGVVAELGEGVTGLEVGQEVYGQASPLSGHGSFAEFTAVKATSLAPKPTSIDFVTAAAIPLTGASAYQALVDTLHLQTGQKILIHGGAGGIGSFAIQLAKHLGAYVATTTATQDVAFARELGADEVIDYESQKFDEQLHDFDAVYDTVGGETYTRSFAVLKPGGQIVSMLEQPNEDLMQQHQVTAFSQFTKVTQERLTELAKLVDQGAVKVHVGKTFPFEEAAEALEYIHTGHPQGKVTLKI